MRQRVSVCLLLLAATTGMYGQTFREAYEDFRQKAEAEYEDFRKKVNQEYADWLRQAWEWHQKIEPMPRPKDDMLPPIVYDKDKQRSEPKPVVYDEVVPMPEPQPQPKPIAPIRESEGDSQTATFQFFGTNGQVRLPKDFAFRINGKNEEAYATAWDELSSRKYDNLIRDCLVLRMEHQLCDWAYLLMLGTMSESVCGKGTNEATMLQAYVFCQSGYKIRLGFTRGGDLRLLVKSEHDIFDMARFRMDEGLFYLLQPVEDDGLSIRDVAYPEDKSLSLWITQEQKLGEQPSEERLLTSRNKQISVRSQINENLLRFYDTYPTSMVGDNIMSRWAMYANTPLSEKTRELLYPQLQSALKDSESVEESADRLLHWVQTAFVYEYDDKVWGHDRAFFAEETLYYPYCDCEDRSILYSRLVRDFLGLDVVLVFYPGHLATAVNFNAPVNGDYIDLNGNRFTVCDPTYFGASIGETMDGMDNKTAKVIQLSK